jgi:hypothetical protein
MLDTEILIVASKEVGLELNIQKTKYLLLSCYQNAGQDSDIKMANRSFESVSQFKYLEIKLTNYMELSTTREATRCYATR